MSAIQSLIIPCVDYSYTQEYVANAFWKQRIARVSSVTLIPYIKGEWIYYIAYINVDRWCDSENAYNFIRNLNNPSKETRLVHYEDNWWSVEKSVNTFALKDATVLFEPSYYERFIEDKEEEEEDEEVEEVEDEVEDEDEELVWLTDDYGRPITFKDEYPIVKSEYPIKGLSKQLYTVFEAEGRVNTLTEVLETKIKDEHEKYLFRAEIEQLQSSLKMFYQSNIVCYA